MESIRLCKWKTVVLLLLVFTTIVSADVIISVETTDSVDGLERIFKSGGDVYIRTMIRNTGSGTVSGNMQVQIKDENNNLIATLPSQYVSVASGEQKVVKATWNSGTHAEWLSAGGFTFIGKKFKVVAQFSSANSEFQFYVDEFGVDKGLRNLNYYTVGYWWEDVGTGSSQG